MWWRWSCAGWILALLSSSSWAARLEIQTGEARRGDLVEVSVILRTDGRDITATENDIIFDGQIRPLECAVNPAIDRGASAFHISSTEPPRDRDCLTEVCDRVASIIVSFSNVDPLDDGATLYSCLAQVPTAATTGPHVLQCEDAGASTPAADPVDVDCADAVLIVSDAPPRPSVAFTPRPTPTPWPTETAAPTFTQGPPTETPTATPHRQVSVFAFPAQLSAERGGRVDVRVLVADSNDVPLDGARVDLSLAPAVGSISPRSAKTGTVSISEAQLSGTIIASLEIPPNTPAGSVEIRAETGGEMGTATILLWPGAVPPTPPPDPRQSATLGSVFVDIAPVGVDAGEGGVVDVWAFTLDLSGQPYNSAAVSFDHEPRIGTLEVVTSTSTTVQSNGQTLHGVAQARILVPPGTESPTEVTVSASTSRSGGRGTFRVEAEPAVPVTTLVLEVDPACPVGGSSLNVRAIAFDANGDRLNDRRVLFHSDGIGSFRPYTFRTGHVIGHGDGVAPTELRIEREVPVRTDPATGAILPWTIRARSGGVDATAQIFVLPGSGRCTNLAAAPTPAPQEDDGCALASPSPRPNFALASPLVALLLLYWRRRANAAE